MRNCVILLGRVGTDPKVVSKGEDTFAAFNFATEERYKEKGSDEWKKRTDWHRVVVRNTGLAKVVEQYVKKGALLYIEGSNRTRKLEDGRLITEVIVGPFNSKLEMVERRKQEDADPSYDDPGGEAPMPDDGEISF